jgi:hypothetical protein
MRRYKSKCTLQVCTLADLFGDFPFSSFLLLFSIAKLAFGSNTIVGKYGLDTTEEMLMNRTAGVDQLADRIAVIPFVSVLYCICLSDFSIDSILCGFVNQRD